MQTKQALLITKEKQNRSLNRIHNKGERKFYSTYRINYNGENLFQKMQTGAIK